MKSNLKLWNAGSSQDRPRTKETHLDSIGNNLVKTTIFTFLLHWAKVAFNPIVEEIKIAENTPMIVLFLEKANCQFREHYSLIDSYLNINVWEKNWVFWVFTFSEGNGDFRCVSDHLRISVLHSDYNFLPQTFWSNKDKKISLLK